MEEAEEMYPSESTEEEEFPLISSHSDVLESGIYDRRFRLKDGVYRASDFEILEFIGSQICFPRNILRMSKLQFVPLSPSCLLPSPGLNGFAAYSRLI